MVVLLGTLAVGATGNQRCGDDEPFFACHSTVRTVLGVVPTSVLLVGAVGAFVVTYRVWRARGEWRIWHAAGWALFVAMSVYILLAGPYLVAD